MLWMHEDPLMGLHIRLVIRLVILLAIRLAIRLVIRLVAIFVFTKQRRNGATSVPNDMAKWKRGRKQMSTAKLEPCIGIQQLEYLKVIYFSKRTMRPKT